MSATDLDRYLTDEVMERAAESLHEFLAMSEEIRLTYVPDYSELGEGVKLRRQHEARAALAAVLPDIIQQAKVEALRDAADEFWARLPDGTGNGRAYNSHRVADMLRDRADRIEQGGRP